jgi:uroporphyrinogen III methyltransferase / synthase
VFYMGVRQLQLIAESLIAAGRSPEEPAAVVERGTLPEQRTVRATLATIASRASEEDIKAPSITIVGAVAGLAEQLAWRSPGPLSGRTVAVTRARAQASGLARRLTELGASVVETPAIRVEPIPGGPLDLRPYDLICLTSPNGVKALFERLAQAKGSAEQSSAEQSSAEQSSAEQSSAEQSINAARDARAFGNACVAAIGPGTARALREHGIFADVVPEHYVAESLIEALADIPIHRALVARAREAREVLPEALRARGAEVDVVALYETLAEPLPQRTLQAAMEADYITFTSSSTVRFFLQAAGEDPTLSSTTRIVSIGPVTSETLREHGIEPHIEAETHDIDGLLAALLKDAAARTS